MERSIPGAKNGVDYTSQVNSAAGLFTSLYAGGILDLIVLVTPEPTVPTGQSCVIKITAGSKAAPDLTDVVQIETTSSSGSGCDGLYTRTTDFLRGALVGLVATNDQLQLAQEAITLPFI